MKIYIPAFLFGLLFCNSINLFAQNKKLSSEKSPSWVTADTVDYANTSLDNEAEDGYIDIAFEEQILLEQQTAYYKKAFKIISEAGIQNRSQLSVDFDPSYQRLVFHNITIIRDGKRINKLDLGKIKVVQEETELSRYVYNGALTAVIFLEDVRKGDAIEYSYSIKGFNPVFKGKFADNFDAAYGVPVYLLYYKIISAANRNLEIKNSLLTTEPAITTAANQKSYEWKFTNVHALHLQDKTPSWYDAYPMVMVSEYKSWKEVSDWAAALFPQAVAISAGLKKKIEELRAASPTDEGQVLAAIRFVQDDVRYMGIEMGVNSHLPNNPNKIFEQRFGDCKDKSYLLCTILRSLGFEADPVLINSVYKKTIFNWQPSCYAFDHCTVRMKVNERYHFIDPTISYQRGGINDISFPDYQCGLIVTDTATALSIIPLQEKGMVKVKELITIPDMLGKATLVATTEYTGSYADVMRDEFKNNSIYEMQKDFLNFYANYFTETTVADSLKIKDDENTGKFTTTEYYNIDKIWELKDGVKKVSLYAFMINSIIQKPKDLSRTMPVRLTYPAHYNEEVEIDLPEKWKVEDSHDKISCAAFTLDADFTYSNKKIFLKYDYQALKDNAAPAEAKEFLNGIKKFDDELGFGVTYKEAGTIADDDYSNASSPTRSNIAYTILSVIAIVVAVVVRTQRRR